MRVAVALLLVASLLPGCTSSGGGSGPLLVTARAAQPAADHDAVSWSDDAVLHSVSAVEMDAAARKDAAGDLQEARDKIDQAHADGDLDDEAYGEAKGLLDAFALVTQADGDVPGDGKAAVWFFLYDSPSKGEPFAVGVSRGHVVLDGSGDLVVAGARSSHDADPLDAWTLDSDDAAAAAGLGSADYASVCGGTNVVAFTSLAQQGDQPTWFFSARNTGDDLGAEASLAVSALNGSLVQDPGAEPALDQVEQLWQESGQDEGNILLGTGTTQTSAFEVRIANHTRLAFLANANGIDPQPMTFTVTDPEGTRTDVAIPFGRSRESVVLAAVPRGTYQVEVSSQLTPFANWAYAWCADGAVQSEPDPFEQQACDALDGDGGGVERPQPLASWGETLSRLAPWVRAWPN